MCRHWCTQLLTPMYQEKSYVISKVDFLNFYGRGYITTILHVKGGLRMVDFELMIKALRLAWIPRLLKSGQYLPRFETAVSSSGTKEGLEDFTTFVNNFHPSLKFTWAISDDKLSFLDLLTYHPRNTQAREITTRNFALLKSDPDTKDIFQPVRILCAYRHDNNLRDILVKSSLQTTGPTNGESGTCGCRRCVTCAHTNPSRTLDTPGGQLRFEDRFTCTTSNLIYVSTPRAVN